MLREIEAGMKRRIAKCAKDPGEGRSLITHLDKVDTGRTLTVGILDRAAGSDRIFFQVVIPVLQRSSVQLFDMFKAANVHPCQ